MVLAFERETLYDDADGVRREGKPRTANFLLCSKVSPAIDEACQHRLRPSRRRPGAIVADIIVSSVVCIRLRRCIIAYSSVAAYQRLHHRHCHQHGISCRQPLCFRVSDGDEDDIGDHGQLIASGSQRIQDQLRRSPGPEAHEVGRAQGAGIGPQQRVHCGGVEGAIWRVYCVCRVSGRALLAQRWRP